MTITFHDVASPQALFSPSFLLLFLFFLAPSFSSSVSPSFPSILRPHLSYHLFSSSLSPTTSPPLTTATMDIRTSHTTLDYPLYVCDFDPTDAGRLIVGGGGGASRTGVGNKLVRPQALFTRLPRPSSCLRRILTHARPSSTAPSPKSHGSQSPPRSSSPKTKTVSPALPPALAAAALLSHMPASTPTSTP